MSDTATTTEISQDAARDMLAALRQAAVALAAIRGEQFRAPQMSALDAVRAAIAKAEAR